MDIWCWFCKLSTCAKESSGLGHFLHFPLKYFYKLEGTKEGSLTAMVKLCAHWLEKWDYKCLEMILYDLLVVVHPPAYKVGTETIKICSLVRSLSA